MRAKKAGFFQYIKRAFVHHWNLLLLGAGMVAGAISGHADVAIPVLVAAELAYLTALAAHPKFQAYVDAQLHKAGKQQAQAGPALERVLSALDARSKTRFARLKDRCVQLRQLAMGLNQGRGGKGLERLQVDGINKMLWVFLKLLYSRHVLEQFLDRTTEDEIRQDLARIERSIAELGPQAEDSPESDRRRRTLQDTLASVKLRLDNLHKAKDNHELLELELDRIESKITSIAELGVNRQDPDFVTTEVDGVAASMAQTEAAMSDLHLLSDLDTAQAPPPPFLEEQLEIQQ